MPFIGNKPSAVPLTSADIADGIITSAKIVDGTIVNADINASAAIVATKLTGITSPAGFRNIVINSDMQIAQRSTSVASLTSTAYTYPTLDRWFFSRTADCGTWTMSQSTDVPSGYGFANSLKLDCTATASVSGASTDLRIMQKFEGQNLQYLKYGSANAQSTTLSFWVKSTKTGTFIAELNSKDTRSISKSYTVSVSNTWEYKTITFAGDVSGVIDNDNSEELTIIFWLVAGTTFTSGTLNTSWGSMTNANRAVGQVNIGDNTANDFLITGIQLEAGTSATDFEFLPIDVSFDRCLRYYEQLGVGSFAMANDTTSFWTSFNFRKRKRGNPTASLLTQSFEMTEWGLATNTTTSATIVNSYLTNNDAVYVQLGGFTSVTAGDTATPTSTFAESNGLRPFIAFNSEL